MTTKAGELLVDSIVPRIHSLIRGRFGIGCHDASELIQDSIAIAAQLLERVERAGKSVTAGNIAFYAVRTIKSGRRSTGSSKTDVMAPWTQLKGRSFLHSLDEPIASHNEEGETFTLGEMLASDTEDPSMAAARNMDWAEFLADQGECCRIVVRALAEGGQLQEAARQHGFSPSWFTAVKHRMSAELQDAWGTAVLNEIGHEPRWRDNVRALRERCAVRRGETVAT